MTIRKLNYALKTDRGVFSTLKRNAIIVGDASGYAEFNTPLDVQDYIKQRRIAVLKRKEYQDETGALDESKVADFYVEHYARPESIAIPFEAGLTLKTSHPYPISYGDKIYECIQGHTTQSDWTPDVTPALFSEIQAPGASGYPAWEPPTGAHDAYDLGTRVTHSEKNWESTIPANTTEPGTLLPWGYWKEVN